MNNQKLSLDIWLDLKKLYPNLIFIEETHQYFIVGKRLPSVSSLIKDFYEEFDTEFQISKYALSRGFSEDQVSSAWGGENKISTDKGTKIHLFGEDYVKYKYFGIGDIEPLPFCKQSLAIVEFWNNLPSNIIPVALEIQMYDNEDNFCGTADILLYDLSTNKYILADYKTNKELIGDPTYFKQMDHLKTHLNQDNLGKYTIQLNLYQILLERKGIEVSHRWIVFLQEDKENKKLYQIHEAVDLQEELENWLKFRHKYITYF